MTQVPARRTEPTMRDIAALAGVSIKTVSRVINEQGGAGADVVQRVREAVQALGYRPNLTASSLRRTDRLSATLGVLVEDLSNPFDSVLLRAVEERAQRDRVLVLAGSAEDNLDLQRERLGSLAARRVDGMVIMAASGPQDDLQQERSHGTPMVLVDRPPTFGHTDSVTTTNRESSREAVLQLASYGHRHIGFLGGRQSIWTSQERRTGYLEGLAEAGLRLREELMGMDLKGVEAAERAVAAMLDVTHPPTALFTAQNLITVGAMRVLQARGWKHRVALIGFDDFPLADMVDPAITVVRQDVPLIGRTAADLVLARIQGDQSPAVRAVVPADLIRRGSGELRPSPA